MSNFFGLVSKLERLIEVFDLIVGGSDIQEVLLPDGSVKGSIEKRISDQFSTIKASLNGQGSFDSKASIDLDLEYEAGTSARVWRDPVPENNGLYEKLGAIGSGSWQKSEYDNYDEFKSQVTELSNAQRSLDGKINYGMHKQGIESADNQDVKVVAGPLSVDEDLIAAFSDENGYSPLLISKIGEIIIPLLRANDLKVGGDAVSNAEMNYALAVTDEAGNPAFGVDVSSGEVWAGLVKLFGTLKLGDSVEILHGEYNYDYAIVDEMGNPATGVFQGKLISGDSSSSVDVVTRDQNNLASSNQVKQFINTTSARHEFDYNHIVVYGQSLSTGHEGWPALSTKSYYGNLMLGDCVRPQSTDGDEFNAFGGSVLKPLVSNVQKGTQILTNEEVALLTSGDGSLGEVVNFGMLNFAKRLFNRTQNIPNDSREFVTTNCGVSGKTIEQLSKVNTQDGTHRYSRFSQSVQAVKNIADVEGKSYGVTALVWMQGEWNYRADKGGVTSYEDYKALLAQLRLDQISDIKSVSGQTDDPIFITYQTGAGYTSDEDGEGVEGLSVGMAQWDFTKENSDSYLAGPIYPYTDKGGHLDANGYRWYGNMLGKIYHKVVTLGQDWRPLSPVKSSVVGADVFIDFHVPEPPLVFSSPYVIQDQLNYLAKGFRVSDELGENAVTDAEIVGDTIVKLSLRRPVEGGGHIWYADKTKHAGNGCLRDSDNIVAHDVYEYKPEVGMYEAANHPELIDKPYPLHNWCIAFYIPINWEEK